VAAAVFAEGVEFEVVGCTTDSLPAEQPAAMKVGMERTARTTDVERLFTSVSGGF
jgi:hypothetical protein